MGFRDLFIVETRKAQKGETVASGARGGAVGVFITPKSLLTFPTASFVVSLLGVFSRKLFPEVANSIWVSVVSAFFVGLVIFVATTSAPSVKPRSWQDWFLAISVGLVNCIYLAATALGLLTVNK